MTLTRRSLLAGLCSIAATASAAQESSIRSGEHGAFTRLVAEIGADREWVLRNQGHEFFIEFTPDNPQFGVSTIYERITRDRIANVTAENGLEIELGCNCDISIERYRDTFIIIDVSEAAESTLDLEHNVSDPSVPQAALVADLPMFAGTRQSDAIPPASGDPVTPTPPTPSSEIANAANILAEQMARATAAGLLNVAPDEPFSSADPSVLAAADQDAATGSSDGLQTGPIPISTLNAFDLNADTPAVEIFSPFVGECMQEPDRPFVTWDEDWSFSHGIGVLRSGLYNDRGALNEEMALRLAEFYLAHGFGAEADFWLNEHPHPPVFHRALADFLEDHHPNAFGPFDGALDCRGEILFWIFLAADSPSQPSVELKETILGAYFQLSGAARDQFGPILVRRFLSVGEEGAAMEIRENLVLGSRLSPSDLQLMDAEMAYHSPNNSGSSSPTEVFPSAAGSHNANRAMALYLRNQIQVQGTVTPEDLMAADALILETDPGLEEYGLVHMTTVGHALRGNVEVVLQHLLRGQDQIGQRVFTDIVQTLMEQQHTAELILLLSSPEFGQFGQFQNHAFRRRVARYFLDHGVPNMTRDIIASGGAPHELDREILSAAMARLARDASTDIPIFNNSGAASGPLPEIGETASEISSLLVESAAMRGRLEEILSAEIQLPAGQ